MAYTKTNYEQTTFGNKKVSMFTLTLDAASGAVDTGLGVITQAFISPVSAASSAIKMIYNQNSATTALPGSLFLKAASSGDAFQIICYGR